MDPYKDLFESIIKGNEQKAVDLCTAAVASGYRPVDILEKGMIPAMDHLGSLFAKEQVFIPQILMAAKAMQAAVNCIQPVLLGRNTLVRQHTVVVGTVKGDIHTIGKDLVSIMLQSAGFQVVDLGVNASAQQFVDAVRQHRAQSVALSAMLTTSMRSMRDIVCRLREEDFGYPLQIIIGGGLVTSSFAHEINAEFAFNMMETASLVQAASERHAKR